ncbi:hypothetical protein DHEL01_v209741 [Diaporthe helianthi]|uniref:Uncharacterized protein n=1 Tax=Diaporthe helianthi TaxID=158607 RepID=A0A2P5HNQ5_DIAHE|nr:hypothetical protein DHEL01_v209741 [Diaporthe helianthi]
MNGQHNSESMEPTSRGTFGDDVKYRPRGNNIPRILLRGWHPLTTAAVLGLNTDRGIYPFAWRFRVRRAPGEPAVVPHPLTDLSRGEVLALAAGHIGGDTDSLTPFTSWSADLPTAVFFALGEYDLIDYWIMSPEPGHIAVLDLSRRPHPLIHATDLGWLSLPMEYLVHGPVTEGLRVVSIAAIRSDLGCPLFPFCHSVRREPHAVTEEEIRDAVGFGLLFLSAADTYVDVAIILAASFLSWGQVPVRSPHPLGVADILRADRQQTRPWPRQDLDSVLTSRLLVHNGAFPPLSGAILANSLTSTVGAPQLELTLNLLTRIQEAWGPANSDGNNASGTSQARLTRGQWEAAFREAAGRHEPNAHQCGPFVCQGCDVSLERADEPDYSRPDLLFHCSARCAALRDLREAIDRTSESP